MYLSNTPNALTNLVELKSITDGQITKVNLYPSRADICRRFLVNLKIGPNRLNISGLPSALDKDSVRVTGKGSAIIHDVTVSVLRPSQSAAPKTTALKDLLRKRARTEKAITHCHESIATFKGYLATLDVQHVPLDDVLKFTTAYETAASQFDDKVLDLEEQLELTNQQIREEESKHKSLNQEAALRTHVGIDLDASSDGHVEILLNYAADNCSWKAAYDIRADMESETSGRTIVLTYKASISQNTGESWENIPLTLETVNPTFGADIPTLKPWNISLVDRYYSWGLVTRSRSSIPLAPGSSTRSNSSLPKGNSSPKDKETNKAPDDSELMAHQPTAVAVEGVVSATFQVPGLTTVPCDGATHNVILSELSLEASMSWVSVPKSDTKAYLKAKITNTSEFALLEGKANVFLNGSFTANSNMPFVSPQATFDFALGVDPSLRITYHPRSSKSTQLHGYIYSKQSTTQSCEQRITVFNSKSVPVELKIVDQIPTTTDTHLKVKLLKPELPAAVWSPAGKRTNTKVLSEAVKVGDGIVAHWEGSDNPEVDPDGLGKDGKITWMCSLAPHTTAHLALSWEVSSSEGHRFEGL